MKSSAYISRKRNVNKYQESTKTFFSFFIEFIGVTRVNKIVHVSSVQFCDTSLVHCIVCLPQKVKSSIIIYLTPFTSRRLLPSGNQHTLICVYDFLLVLFVHLLLSILYPTYE